MELSVQPSHQPAIIRRHFVDQKTTPKRYVPPARTESSKKQKKNVNPAAFADDEKFFLSPLDVLVPGPGPGDEDAVSVRDSAAAAVVFAALYSPMESSFSLGFGPLQWRCFFLSFFFFCIWVVGGMIRTGPGLVMAIRTAAGPGYVVDWDTHVARAEIGQGKFEVGGCAEERDSCVQAGATQCCQIW